ncbi:MAG: CHASE2 domain-containing protein [Paenacidovorax caeni]
MLWFSGPEHMPRINHLVQDTVSWLYPRRASPDIVIVTIDAPSLQAIGRWPWRRALHAELIQRISAHTPRHWHGHPVGRKTSTTPKMTWCCRPCATAGVSCSRSSDVALRRVDVRVPNAPLRRSHRLRQNSAMCMYTWIAMASCAAFTGKRARHLPHGPT